MPNAELNAAVPYASISNLWPDEREDQIKLANLRGAVVMLMVYGKLFFTREEQNRRLRAAAAELLRYDEERQRQRDLLGEESPVTLAQLQSTVNQTVAKVQSQRRRRSAADVVKLATAQRSVTPNVRPDYAVASVANDASLLCLRAASCSSCWAQDQHCPLAAQGRRVASAIPLAATDRPRPRSPENP